LGLIDLLPSSPLVHHKISFAPSLSGLTSAATSSEKVPVNIGSLPAANTSSASLALARSHSPSGPSNQSHSASLSNSSTSAGSSTIGPPVVALDFCTLMSHDATNAQMVRTVNDLTKWLSVLEGGFTKMLEQSTGDSIAEEQEEVAVENLPRRDTETSKWDSVTDIVLESN